MGWGVTYDGYTSHPGRVVAVLLGPLHMSPVDRASPVTEISPHSYFLCKNFDVFI